MDTQTEFSIRANRGQMLEHELLSDEWQLVPDRDGRFVFRVFHTLEAAAEEFRRLRALGIWAFRNWL